MGRTCKREHGSKRTAFAALLATGVLAALLALTGFATPSPAFAAELQGKGTADEPTLIYNTDDLIAWCNELTDKGVDWERTQYARLMNDLTGPGIDGTEYGGAVTDDVVKAMAHPDLQAAEFDGNGHLVELQLTTHEHGGLFKTGGKPNGAGGSTTVKDLHLLGSVMHAHAGSDDRAATLFESVGTKDNPSDDRHLKIESCTSQAYVFGEKDSGGFIGAYYDNKHGNLLVTNCANFGDVTSNDGDAGGMVGRIDTPGTVRRDCAIRYSSNNGYITAWGNGNAGGMAGCMSVGENYLADFDYCFNQGTVFSYSGAQYAGGLVGYFENTFYYSNSQHEGCYNAGLIRALADHAGGIIGGVSEGGRGDVIHSFTSRESVPESAVSDNSRNGTIVRDAELSSSHVLSELGYDVYEDDRSWSCTNSEYPVLKETGAGLRIESTWISPLTSRVDQASYHWNMIPGDDGYFKLPSSYSPDGYHRAYWTREAPKADGTWDAPPKKYQMDQNDIHDRIYGGEPVFYAYCVPDSYTVKFELNPPGSINQYKMDPTGTEASKTVMEGDPLGALPVCSYTGTKVDEGCSFLGWATERDGSDPSATWAHEDTTDLADYADSKNIVTLYAQWGEPGLPAFEIFRQPEDWTLISAEADAIHEVCFDFATSFKTSSSDGFDTTLQRKKGGTWEDVCPVGHNDAQHIFYIDSMDEARYDYRFKIDYQAWPYEGTVYTGSARIVLDIPQTQTKVSSVELKDDTEEDEALGTHSYDVNGSLVGDIPELMDQENSSDYGHLAWIEGGPTNIITKKQYFEPDYGSTRSFTLENQHLHEGQTYTLCVARTSPRYNIKGNYQGESEPYRVPFVVPYADNVAASITPVQVTDEPVVKDTDNGKKKPVNFHQNYDAFTNETINLAADVEFAQPLDRDPVVLWDYYKDGWSQVPDEYFVKDDAGNPIKGVAWNDDLTSARLYAAVRADMKFDDARFRVRLSTPPAPVDTVSEWSPCELTVFAPAPKDVAVGIVDDGTRAAIDWAWSDGAGRTQPDGGFKVTVELGNSVVYEQSFYSHEPGQPVYVDLESQKHYVATVEAYDGGKKNWDTCDFDTQGKLTCVWDQTHLTDDGIGQWCSVDYDWAGYDDGKHVARYEWRLTKKLEDPQDEDFSLSTVTTDDSMVYYPNEFKNLPGGWDPTEAEWCDVIASVWETDSRGNPTKKVEDTEKHLLPIPVLHATSEPLKVTVENVGSYSASVSWGSPEEGTPRAYRITVTGATSYTVEVPSPGKQTLDLENLVPGGDYQVTVSACDPRSGVNLATSEPVSFTTAELPQAGTWSASVAEEQGVVGTDTLHIAADYAADSGDFKAAIGYLYTWREGDDGWVDTGETATVGNSDESRTMTFEHELTSADYGRQWRVCVVAERGDGTSTVWTNPTAADVEPPRMTNVELGEATIDSLKATFPEIEGIKDADGGYIIEREEIDESGSIVRSTTYLVNAREATAGADGKLHRKLTGLKPDTEYRVIVSAFANGVEGESGVSSGVKTLAEPTIEVPAFSQMPKSVRVEPGADAVFTAQASVGDGGGALSYRWQRKAMDEQDFSDIAASEKYAIGTDETTGATTLTVHDVDASDVGVAIRCVAANAKSDQTAEAASGAAYLTVVPAPVANVQAQATSPTSGEITWTPSGAVRRYAVSYQYMASPQPGPMLWKVVTIEEGAQTGACQLDGLKPGMDYSVYVYAAPLAGFWSSASQSYATLKLPQESALAEAAVSPDKKVADAGETVEFKVSTNVDAEASEELEYRWQRNVFGDSWCDVDGGDAATLSVTAPEGGAADGYRCIVTSTRTTKGDFGKVVGTDRKSVTSSTGLLLTSVPVGQPVQLAAEASTTSAHLSWTSADVRSATYEVQYAEGPKPVDDAWVDVENVGANTSCDVEGLDPNVVYSWRVRAVVRGELQSDWASGGTFVTLAETSALSAVSVTPRFGTAVAGSGEGVTYTATTNLDNAQSGETLSYQWQESATGDHWSDVPEQTGRTMVADASSSVPRSCLYRCVVTAGKDGVALKSVTSEAVSFMTVPKVPAGLVASNITAAAVELAWTNALNEGDGLSYRVFWRESGSADWQSASTEREASYTLSSLKPATTYEWCVQVMNGVTPSVRSATSLFVTQSLPLVPQLTHVVVGPMDQTVEAGEQATFAALTNVDDVDSSVATKTYMWEKRGLNSSDWAVISGAEDRVLTLDAGTNAYVRCTVTYNPVGLAAVPLAGTSVASNEARVRVTPAPPSGLQVSDVDKTSAKVAWSDGGQDVKFDLVWRAVGASEWNQALGWDSNSAPVTLTDLVPGTVYEWGVRSTATYSDPLSSDWVAGPPFVTLPEDIVFSKVEVAPSAFSVVVGTDSTVELVAKADNDVDHEQLSYQWQQRNADSGWDDLQEQTGATLQVSTKDMPVGTYGYRCVVKATRGIYQKEVTSNESIVTVTPLAPVKLQESDIEANTATFGWTWDGALADGDEFVVGYHMVAGPAGIKNDPWHYSNEEDIISNGKLVVDNENRTCKAALLAERSVYEWRVRVVKDGVTSSWSEVSTFITPPTKPVEGLYAVAVAPSDQLVGADDSVELSAATNVDDDQSKGTLTYRWEWCALTEKPYETKTSWKEIEGATGASLTLSGEQGETNRYVRCTVTQTVGETSTAVASNPARIRVEPSPPSDPYVVFNEEYYNNGITLGWTLSGRRYGVDGYEMEYRMAGASEWTTRSSFVGLGETLNYSMLTPGASYEWRVRTIMSDGPVTEWVDGPAFTAPKVDATPARAAAVVGNGRTLTFTATPAVDVGVQEPTGYQWQRKEAGSSSWTNLENKTSSTLSIEANTAAEAGTSTYRCLVTMRPPKKDGSASDCLVPSNAVSCTLAPAAPTGLTASDVESDRAALAWEWSSGSLSGAAYNVFYRESGTVTWTKVAALQTSCMVEGLKPDTVYEWRVQTVQNGVESLPSFANVFSTAAEHSDAQLEAVVVEPADLVMASSESAELSAATNLDGVEGVDAGALAYEWQTRALDSGSGAWQTAEGATEAKATLPAGTNAYVRCLATYTVAPGADPVTKASNEARVRVQPDAIAAGLAVDALDETEAALSWSGALPEGCTFTLSYRAAGAEDWASVAGLAEASHTVTGLAPGTKYEWRVRTASDNGLASAWADGPAFTTKGKDSTLEGVVVGPKRVEAEAGADEPVSFSVTGIIGGEDEALAYQWQNYVGGAWADLPGETRDGIQLSVADREAGEHSLRCLVTGTPKDGTPKTVESNTVVVALSPMAPSGLAAEGAADTATLAWSWAGPGSAGSFIVEYRVAGTEPWTPAENVDSQAMKCVLEGLEPVTAYEWRVRAVQNGVDSTWSDVASFSTAPALVSVTVDPASQEVAPDARAAFTAVTNLDDVEGAGYTLSYAWERRALDSDSEAWIKIEDETGRELTLPAGTDAYVRCTVEQAFGNGSKVSKTSDAAAVRVKPAAPAEPKVGEPGETEVRLSWSGTLPEGGSYELSYKKADAAEWTEVGDLHDASYQAEGLEPGTDYAWRVRAASPNGLASEWVDGPEFRTASKGSLLKEATVSPASASGIAGSGAATTFAVTTNVDDDAEESLSFQWQSDQGGSWVDIAGATGRTLEVKADESREAGKHGFRCVATSQRGDGPSKAVESNGAVLALSPAAPSGLAAEAAVDEATLAWAWAGPGTAGSFAVEYRVAGEGAWTSAENVDVQAMQCVLKGLEPATAYEWRVKATQNGVDSAWSGTGSFSTRSVKPVLESIAVDPSSQEIGPSERASLKAATNLGDEDASVAYAWELRALDSDPADVDAWHPVGDGGRSVTLDAGTGGYVRCTAAQALDGGAPVVVTSKEALVLVRPVTPGNLQAGEVGFTDAVLSWEGDAAADTFTVGYRAVAAGADWTEVAGLTSATLPLSGLAEGTAYEWYVQAFRGSGDNVLASEKVLGPSFTTLAHQAYRVIAGADGTWKPGQSGLAFTVNGPLDKFLSVAVDGAKLVLGTDYTVAEGSTVVTLSAAYLAKLSVGAHELTVAFTDGSASAAFSVAQADPGPTPNPPTPDPPSPTPTPDNGGGDSGGKALAPTGDPLAPAPLVVGALAAVCVALVARRKLS